MAEKMPGWSPYNYVFNSPLMFVDPDGRFPVPSPYGLYNRVNAWFFGKNMNALDQGSRLVNAYETASGENASAGIKFSAYFNGVLNEYGAYTSQNDAVVLMTGEHFGGSEATGFDKVMAGVFVALPVSGSAVKNASSSLIKGTIRVFRNGDQVAETAYKFGNLGYPGTKPYREAVEAVKGGGNFVAGSRNEALNILDNAFPGIPNQTGRGQGRFGFRIDEGMSGSGLRNGHDGLHINYYNKDTGVRGTILIDQ